MECSNITTGSLNYSNTSFEMIYTCFFCAQKFENHLGPFTSKQGQQGKAACLKNIWRYLNITPGFVFRKRKLLEENSLNESVQLCSNCVHIADQLNELIRQQEMIKMLLDHQVKVLNQVFLESEQVGLDADSDEEFQNVNNEHISKEGISIGIGKIRDETKRKCLLAVKNMNRESNPKVQLNRLKSEERSSSKVPDEIVCAAAEEAAKLDENSKCISDNVLKDGKSSVDQTIDLMINSQCRLTLGFGEGYQCHFCTNMKPNSRIGHIRNHLVSVHPEKLLPNAVKHPGLSDVTFRKCCRQILFSATQLAAKEMKSYCSSNRKLICLVCQKKCCDGKDFRYHLLAKHSDILEQTLIDFQLKCLQNHDQL